MTPPTIPCGAVRGGSHSRSAGVASPPSRWFAKSGHAARHVDDAGRSQARGARPAVCGLEPFRVPGRRTSPPRRHAAGPHPRRALVPRVEGCRGVARPVAGDAWTATRARPRRQTPPTAAGARTAPSSPAVHVATNVRRHSSTACAVGAAAAPERRWSVQSRRFRPVSVDATTVNTTLSAARLGCAGRRAMALTAAYRFISSRPRAACVADRSQSDIVGVGGAIRVGSIPHHRVVAGPRTRVAIDLRDAPRCWSRTRPRRRP